MKVQQLYDRMSHAGLIDRAPWRPTDAVWRQLGVEVRDRFINLVTKEFESKAYERVLLPSFIPPPLLQKQREHFIDVERLSFSVDDRAGSYLRATSESQFAALTAAGMLHGWPIRIVQVCSVFRKERLEHCLPLLRAVEIDPFLESVTFSACADREMRRERALYKAVLVKLCIPTFEHIRPAWDTFPEAKRTTAFDTILPSGEVVQVATIHNLGSTFAAAFNLRRDGRLMQQTSSGISGRALCVAVAIHATPNRILLPSAICPKLFEVRSDFRNTYKSVLFQYDASRWTQHKDAVLAGVSVPLRIDTTSNRGITISSVLGHRYPSTPQKLPRDLVRAISDYDAALLDRATRRLMQSRIRQQILEVGWCGRSRCLLPTALTKKRRRMQLLGFSDDTSDHGPACVCRRRHRAITCRFGVTM